MVWGKLKGEISECMSRNEKLYLGLDKKQIHELQLAANAKMVV